VKIVAVKQRKEWDSFLSSSRFNYFLQTWDWGDFQEKGLGKKVWRLGFYEDDRLVGVSLCIEEPSRFGRFIYCPRGPILEWKDVSLRSAVVSALVDFFRGAGHVFLRIDPAVKDNEGPVGRELLRYGFQDAVTFVQVERAWMLDIKDKSDDELLAGMRKNSRYYVRKAQKSDVKVRVSDSPNDLKIFTRMIAKLADRKSFAALPAKYFEEQFKYLSRKGILKVFVAEHKKIPVASALIAFYGDEGSYLHAASDPSFSRLQASYLLQWEAIEYARSLGLDKYNFWGVVEDKNYHPGYPGFGYSNFKKGFGGYLEVYMRTKDYPFSPIRYNLVRIWEKLRRMRYKGN